MDLQEGDIVKLKNGIIAKIYSFGTVVNIGLNIINLDNGTFCFEDNIEEVIQHARKPL